MARYPKDNERYALRAAAQCLLRIVQEEAELNAEFATELEQAARIDPSPDKMFGVIYEYLDANIDFRQNLRRALERTGSVDMLRAMVAKPRSSGL
jgi:hypothetical protein